ncbi:heavy metal translocating P-type ATPase [Neisseria meningitidis]|uniref:heavy metal translocating P-type ATPase n=1 Tax=Neisseria meningitidis TaxID=487 RepID=UPI0007666441|nr:heavy metal translocating P-type ATPase [Neisseria meningitidis]CWM36606.1 P-type cation-transporting ATPase [Neisseria meningitidis]
MKKTCFHCGLDVPEHLHLTVRYENEDRETCCAGCQAVAQSIIDAGLGSYYKQRTADAQKTELPPQEILDQIRLYDLPEVQSDFVETHGGTREAVLMLGGITCAACVWLIEQQLLRTDGIVRIDLNYSTHRCRVVWDDGKIRLSDILLKIRQIGYTAAPYDAQKIEAANQKERKQYIVRLAVAGLGMMQTMMFALPTYLYGGDIEPDFLQILHWGGFLMVLPVVFYCAVPFYQGALRDLKNRRVGMDTPITVAIIMTFIAGVYSLATNAGQGMYFESIAMLLFFLLGGRFMEHIARRKAGDAAERLVKLIPAFCHHMPDYPDTQETCEAAVVKLKAGDIVLVKPGETIPVDGTVLEGASTVDESMLTGESLPVAKMPSEKVTAGTLNTQSPLIIRTDRTGGGTRLSHIVRLLDRALAQKPRTAELAEQYASSFIFGELLLAVPVFIGWTLYADAHIALWITVALLVITCPCALSLATPTALAASTGTLAREGILIGGKQAIETLAQTTDIIFDKTGTLTQGKPAVRRISLLRGTDEAFVLAVAQALEQQSEHPLARAILNCRISDGSVPDIAIKQRLNRIGEGVGAQLTVNGETQVWALGRASYVAEISGKEPQTEGGGSAVYLGSQSGFQAVFYLTDPLKDSAAEAVRQLAGKNLTLHILSGDRETAVAETARALGVAHYRAQAMPEDKLEYVKALQKEGKKVLMIGDGINDAPVLAQADVSAAAAGGTDIARDGADIVLLNEDLRTVAHLLDQARRPRHIIRQNLIWAGAYNIIAVPLAVLGYVQPWIAALGMSFSSLAVLGNALRLHKRGKMQSEKMPSEQ